MEEQRPPPSRRSVFIEAPMDMEEYTPANSIHETTFSERRPRNGPLAFWTDGAGRLVLRVANAALHSGVCSVLLAIMITFMVQYEGQKRRPQAIALMAIVAADCCLDIFAVIRLRKDWQGWAIVVRLLLGLGYIAQFLVYVGFRRVFPSRYTYWGMTIGYSEPVVYILLLGLGLWNMLHTMLRRHTLGRDLRQYALSIQLRRQARNQASRQANEVRAASRVSGRGSQQMTSHPADAGQGFESEGPIALGIVQDPEDKKSPAVVVVSHDGMSHKSGESSSQIGSATHVDSTDGTPWASARTSASILLDDRDGSVDAEADRSKSVDIKP